MLPAATLPRQRSDVLNPTDTRGTPAIKTRESEREVIALSDDGSNGCDDVEEKESSSSEDDGEEVYSPTLNVLEFYVNSSGGKVRVIFEGEKMGKMLIQQWKNATEKALESIMVSRDHVHYIKSGCGLHLETHDITFFITYDNGDI